MRKFKVIVNGSEYEVDIEEINEQDNNPPSPAAPADNQAKQRTQAGDRELARPTTQNSQAADGIIIAQMPGTIVDIHVNQGDQIKKGQNLLTLEAMKMANEVVSPMDGVVTEIKVIKGASVNAGDILVVLN